MKGSLFISLLCAIVFFSCTEKNNNDIPPTGPFRLISVKVNGTVGGNYFSGVNFMPVISLQFNARVDRGSVAAIPFNQQSGAAVPYNLTYQANDSIVLIQPVSALAHVTKYNITVPASLRSTANISLENPGSVSLVTGIDSSRKFPTITDNALLGKVQQQTFRYFWDFAHPVSGLARERSNGDNNIVTSGGSGFGIMAIITGIHRGFITRAEGLARMQTIVSFLKNTAQKFHGAFPHWMNGSTGVVIPFSQKDNGADIVETSYLIKGLLCARQYFNAGDVAETALRNDINAIWNAVEWNWFRQNNQNVLYWHWSPNYNWDMNHQIKGWNECLITYVLAASSSGFSIPAIVYANGWASNGGTGFINGNTYFGIQLPLGPQFGGPLFFSHYSFLGINPNGLSDTYTNYATQTLSHTLINYNYCKANPRGYFGYSDSVWGLTSSDVPNGYAANSPTNDIGVISPTAALSSFPFTPAESMAALKFYYYVLGDKLWKEYGFIDAFSLKDAWFAGSFLAIDQGPVITMIENYRSGLLWNLFTSCPEVKAGMINLGFTAPYL